MKNTISKIGFVFTNYNNSRITEDAIKSIVLNDESKDTIIVIVDNKSDEKNIAHLHQIKTTYPIVHIIFNSDNLGYFKGLNEGILYIRNQYKKIEHVVIGNNDLIFSKNFIKQLNACHDLYLKYPVISPNIITLDGLHQNPHVINKISKIREFIYDIYFLNYYLAALIRKTASFTKKISDRKDEEYHEVAQTIYQGYGACYILGPLFFRHFDLLWSPTFLMGEEYFLSKQLADKKYKIYYEPSIVIKHQCHASMGKLPNKKIWKISKESHKVYRKYVKVWS